MQHNASVTQEVLLLLSLKEQFNHLRFYHTLTGRLVLIFGTSSSGKSSLSTALLKKRSDIYHFNRIQLIRNDVFYILHGLYPRLIEALLTHLSRDEIISGVFFRPSLSTEHDRRFGEIFRTLKTIKEELNAFIADRIINHVYDHLMFHAIISKLRDGKTVIIDSRRFQYCLALFEINFYRCERLNLLVFCSFHNLILRLYNRNLSALQKRNFFDARPLLDPLTEFVNIYSPNIENSALVGFFDCHAVKKLSDEIDLDALGKEILSQSEPPVIYPKDHQRTLALNALRYFNATTERTPLKLRPDFFKGPFVKIDSDKHKPEVLASLAIKRFRL